MRSVLVQLNVRVPGHLHARVRRMAADDNRSISRMAAVLLDEALAGRAERAAETDQLRGHLNRDEGTP
jgi:hypothetical protein